MLKDKIKKLLRKDKKTLELTGLTTQTYEPSHETKITS